jgi:phosphoglycolate phosphatase-like HAD superfamily hydrolase
MIKNIFWDFDGVILDSMKIKGDGFVELFKDYDSYSIKKLEEYHYLNGGISRFEKIKYFFNHILEKEISSNEVNQLANKFAIIIESKLFNKDNLIQETVDFIKINANKYNFHIVSGAEDYELKFLCKRFNIDKFFITINGSPVKKELLVKRILDDFNYKHIETILIGDSINDYYASKKNNIKFCGYNNIKLKEYHYINSFLDWRVNEE